jgi:ankyrin repeat protein
LCFFKAFLKICIKRGFNIQANDQDGLNLLHRAAMNRDPKVAEFLISQGLETTSSAEYNVLPSLGRVYPLFFAIKDNRIDLAHLFLVGL